MTTQTQTPTPKPPKPPKAVREEGQQDPGLDTQGELLARIAAQLIAPRGRVAAPRRAVVGGPG
jgi:hypothetical protein